MTNETVMSKPTFSARTMQRPMRLIDPSTGLMQCRVCGSVHVSNLKGGGKFIRGSWQCTNDQCLSKNQSKHE
jgi:hypothetical protein